MGSYEKEWWFYREIAHSVDASAPHCYAALFDESAPDFVLILEDLSNLRPADQLEGLSEDEVALAIDQAVKLHAPRFGDPSIEPLLWHRHGTASVNDFAARLQGAFEFTLPGFEERLGSQVGDEVLDLTRRLQPLVGRWAHGTDTPRTIRHIDFRADNFLFGEAPDAPPIVVVDWGGATPGLGACDVAFVIGGSFPDPAQRASMERELVEDYRQKMATAGVELSKDDCWRDYRFGSIWGLLISVMASMVAEQTERGDKMLSALAVRHSLQISELDALALLD